jgi:tetratricopeptide (TPR) repeat protein
MNNERSVLTRRDVAHELLRVTGIEILRTQVRRKREWAAIYHGFRPQFLTRSIFLRGAPQFSNNVPLLYDLCTVFLDSINAPADPNIRTRFQHIPDEAFVDDSTRHLCEQLRIVDLVDLALAPGEPNDTRGQIEDLPVVPEPAVDETSVGPHLPRSVEPGVRETEDTTRHGPQPDYIGQQVMLEWQPPADNVAEAQQAVTLLGRALVAFVQRQLEALYGPAWLRRGCGKYRDQWKTKADSSTAIEPRTLIGYAELGELKDIILMKDNWPAFVSYFKNKGDVEGAFSAIISLRVSGMHPEDREIYFTNQVNNLNSMVNLAREFHPETAERIDELFQRIYLRSQPFEPPSDVAAAKILINVGEFPDPQIVGREGELQKIQEFWDDEFTRVLSITGAGGVGKTALLEAFTRRLLGLPCPPRQRPDPEVIIYLTAKENYLSFMRRAPESISFRTLHQLYEVTYEMLCNESARDKTTVELRKSILSQARDLRILFALDNLESLDDIEHEAVGHFLDDLPAPSKAILTTRIDRRIGRKIQLDGLPESKALELLIRSIREHNLEPTPEQIEMLREFVQYTKGLPLLLVYCANAIGGGVDIEDVLENLKGKEFLAFLEFSFESSFSKLTNDQIQVLLFLALSDIARTRKNILSIVQDDERLSIILNTLINMSFIRRSAEDKKQVCFILDNSPLRDYVKKRAPERLIAQEHAAVLRAADVLPTDAESPSVSIEVEKALQRAREAAYQGWSAGITELETARKLWGEDPRLLAQLGYYYFRMEKRDMARMLLEKAIEAGLESPETYVHLALVLFYENSYDTALGHAESAITLRDHYPMAEQIAGECLLEKARRERFTLRSDVRLEILQRALNHLRRSLIAEERNGRDEAHNHRSHRLIEQAEWLKEQAEADIVLL